MMKIENELTGRHYYSPNKLFMIDKPAHRFSKWLPCWLARHMIVVDLEANPMQTDEVNIFIEQLRKFRARKRWTLRKTSHQMRFYFRDEEDAVMFKMLVL